MFSEGGLSAGEEGPADEIWESINVLKVDRIDHGVSCLRDQKLLQYLKDTRLPLTVCPLSNLKVTLCSKQSHCHERCGAADWSGC